MDTSKMTPEIQAWLASLPDDVREAYLAGDPSDEMSTIAALRLRSKPHISALGGALGAGGDILNAVRGHQLNEQERKRWPVAGGAYGNPQYGYGKDPYADAGMIDDPSDASYGQRRGG